MITNNFISSKGTRAERVMHSDSDNLEIMVNDMVIPQKNKSELC